MCVCMCVCLFFTIICQISILNEENLNFVVNKNIKLHILKREGGGV